MYVYLNTCVYIYADIFNHIYPLSYLPTYLYQRNDAGGDVGGPDVLPHLHFQLLLHHLHHGPVSQVLLPVTKL